MEYLNDELTEMQQVKRVVQQAIDQYPRLAVFRLTLDCPGPESIGCFQDTVYRQVSELAAIRQLSGRPSPPTILRWIGSKTSPHSYQTLLMLNQDTFYLSRHDSLPEKCFQTMKTLLRQAYNTIRITNELYQSNETKITVLRVDRTQAGHSDAEHKLLQENALSFRPAAITQSPSIFP